VHASSSEAEADEESEEEDLGWMPDNLGALMTLYDLGQWP
jgi:hypothetical protein